jgi:hypothetical protein
LIIGSQSGSIAKIDKKTMVFDHEANLQIGPIVSLANSSEKVYALTLSGTLHSVEGNKVPLSSQVCFMASISGKIK